MHSQAGSRIVETILQALKELRFGSVEIIVHDSKVVQIERREKARMEKLEAQILQGESTLERYNQQLEIEAGRNNLAQIMELSKKIDELRRKIEDLYRQYGD